MIQEEKQLLLKDLCARLPYGLKVNFKNTIHIINALFDDGSFWLDDKDDGLIEEIRPYLRPMSSMTDNERFELLKKAMQLALQSSLGLSEFVPNTAVSAAFEIDYYNEHHFDYRGLIEKGLALEAPEGMYKDKEL